MMHKFVKFWLTWFWIPLGLDRLTKYLVVSGRVSDQKITSFADIYLTFNRGISWSIASFDNPVFFNGLTIIILCILACFLCYAIFYPMKRYAKSAAFMVLAGGTSNVIDRFLYAGVADFIKFHYAGWTFPIFNIADIFICFGAAVLLYQQLFDDK